jgi:hypothetical protein
MPRVDLYENIESQGVSDTKQYTLRSFSLYFNPVLSASLEHKAFGSS